MTISLRCVSWLVKFPLPSLTRCVPTMGKLLFKLLKNYAKAGAKVGENFEMVLSAFKVRLLSHIKPFFVPLFANVAVYNRRFNHIEPCRDLKKENLFCLAKFWSILVLLYCQCRGCGSFLLFQSDADSLIAKFNHSHFKYYITLKVKDENLLNISSATACVLSWYSWPWNWLFSFTFWSFNWDTFSKFFFSKK